MFVDREAEPVFRCYLISITIKR